MGFVVNALNAEMTGRPWEIPSGESVLQAMDELVEDEDAEPARHAGLLRELFAQTLWVWISPLGIIAWEYVVRRAETRQVFLSHASVAKLVDAAKEEVKREFQEEWISTGDVLFAWMLKVRVKLPDSGPSST